MIEINFYDTSSLLTLYDKLNTLDYFMISSISWKELENIKDSIHKDAEIKYKARKVIKWLNSNENKYCIYVYEPTFYEGYATEFELTDDLKIILTAGEANADEYDVTLYSEDGAFRGIAAIIFPNMKITQVGKIEEESYAGFFKATMSQEEMSYFYSNLNENIYDLYQNEYLLVYDENGQHVDTFVWDGIQHIKISYKNFNSKWFGTVKPYSNDIYQAMVCDSFLRNQFTMIKGSAGTGKTFLSLGYLFYLLDSHKIDKIIVFCNTVATKNSAKLGYLPGSRDEKLLDAQIGNLLISKIGSRFEVERLIQEEQLVLLPMSDIRGYDTTGMRAGVYISEAQNLDIDLMKLALQRIGEDSICIIDGDEKTQVDDINFAGSRNGMRRASQVFRGTDLYGEVELQTIHRSKIAEIAEKM